MIGNLALVMRRLQHKIFKLKYINTFGFLNIFGKNILSDHSNVFPLSYIVITVAGYNAQRVHGHW